MKQVTELLYASIEPFLEIVVIYVFLLKYTQILEIKQSRHLLVGVDFFGVQSVELSVCFRIQLLRLGRIGSKF